MLVERVPYPEDFPQERRALIEVAIYEAEKVLDNSPNPYTIALPMVIWISQSRCVSVR